MEHLFEKYTTFFKVILQNMKQLAHWTEFIFRIYVMGVPNKPLELGMSSSVRKYAINIELQILQQRYIYIIKTLNHSRGAIPKK
jgi:hypothetical protein